MYTFVHSCLVLLQQHVSIVAAEVAEVIVRGTSAPRPRKTFYTRSISDPGLIPLLIASGVSFTALQVDLHFLLELCIQYILCAFFCLVVIGLLYTAVPDGCQHQITFLLRLRPHPCEGASALVLCALFLTHISAYTKSLVDLLREPSNKEAGVLWSMQLRWHQDLLCFAYLVNQYRRHRNHTRSWFFCCRPLLGSP